MSLPLKRLAVSLRAAIAGRFHAIEAYLTQVVAPAISILLYDREAAAWHAGERARLTAIGKTPPFAGGIIAANNRCHSPYQQL
jgi:tRNA(fMet)-specific endonuclease VapC